MSVDETLMSSMMEWMIWMTSGAKASDIDTSSVRKMSNSIFITPTLRNLNYQWLVIIINVLSYSIHTVERWSWSARWWKLTLPESQTKTWITMSWWTDIIEVILTSELTTGRSSIFPNPTRSVWMLRGSQWVRYYRWAIVGLEGADHVRLEKGMKQIKERIPFCKPTNLHKIPSNASSMIQLFFLIMNATSSYPPALVMIQYDYDS